MAPKARTATPVKQMTHDKEGGQDDVDGGLGHLSDDEEQGHFEEKMPRKRTSLATFMASHKELVAGTAYCVMSTSMVLVNKHALSSFRFECPNALLFLQCAISCLLLKSSEAFGLISVEPLSWRVIRVWLPANLLFVAMVWTSFYALKSLNVAMVTVLKNLTNLITICGDIWFNGKRYPAGVWLTLFLMTASAVAGASTDLTFNLRGYLWQLLNCLVTASYSLYLRTVMDKVQALCRKTGGFDELSMVWYNNALSLPLILALIVGFEEHKTLLLQPALYEWQFRLVAVVSGLIGFAISFCSLWFLSCTTATTYSLTGSLNKIPLAIIGLVTFNAKPTLENTSSVLIGLLAGVVFGYVKSRKAPTHTAQQNKTVLR
uniref:GDP-mannose transporter n=1 Tax=Tetraselmis sp. GSL018 TaxID=582737 RepID=A0A061S7F4_9CHLO|mmetsp:Transcript_33326/g.79036  ORF Transcript_33326/g.79036 Transcript_33326/m.79036 type:complete len:375 (+) Transcript_33326:287-1411(+)